MARPAEKARAMLNKWVALREKGNTPAVSDPKNRRRPVLASECEHLADAERFRSQLIREISHGISKIQNPALPEHEVRDLNDDINRKLREKWHWNRRIRELGGLDYNAIEKQRQIEEGDPQQHQGYRYFGVAKNLPGVAQLLQQEEERWQKKALSSIHQSHTHLTPDYYGWRDEEDGVLLELEDNNLLVSSLSLSHSQKKRRTTFLDNSGEPSLVVVIADHLANVPSQEDVAKLLLEQKKKQLLQELGI